MTVYLIFYAPQELNADSLNTDSMKVAYKASEMVLSLGVWIVPFLYVLSNQHVLQLRF